MTSFNQFQPSKRVPKWTQHRPYQSEGKEIRCPTNDTVADSPGNPPEDDNPAEEGQLDSWRNEHKIQPYWDLTNHCLEKNPQIPVRAMKAFEIWPKCRESTDQPWMPCVRCWSVLALDQMPSEMVTPSLQVPHQAWQESLCYEGLRKAAWFFFGWCTYHIYPYSTILPTYPGKSRLPHISIFPIFHLHGGNPSWSTSWWNLPRWYHF